MLFIPSTLHEDYMQSSHSHSRYAKAHCIHTDMRRIALNPLALTLSYHSKYHYLPPQVKLLPEHQFKHADPEHSEQHRARASYDLRLNEFNPSRARERNPFSLTLHLKNLSKASIKIARRTTVVEAIISSSGVIRKPLNDQAHPAKSRPTRTI